MKHKDTTVSVTLREVGSVGVVLATVLSWTTNASVAWAIGHASLGWIYVIYWLFVYGAWR